MSTPSLTRRPLAALERSRFLVPLIGLVAMIGFTPILAITVSPDLVYYSVFVLSTIGPQDVRPISSAARSWTGIEAMVGQLYLAVLIAPLVSQHAMRGDE